MKGEQIDPQPSVSTGSRVPDDLSPDKTEECFTFSVMISANVIGQPRNIWTVLYQEHPESRFRSFVPFARSA